MNSRYARPQNSSLYVRNVPYGNPEDIQEDLKEMFCKYGPVRDVYVPVDYYTHRPRGFAYVQFESGRDADEALYYLDRTTFRGRELEVEFARGDRKTPREMRVKDRETSPRRRDRSRSRSPRRSRSRSPRRRRAGGSPSRRQRNSWSYSRSRSRSKSVSSEHSHY